MVTNPKDHVTQVLPSVWNIGLMKYRKETLLIFILDFKKTFNEIPHERLLTELKAFTGKLLNWIHSFIIGRNKGYHKYF